MMRAHAAPSSVEDLLGDRQLTPEPKDSFELHSKLVGYKNSMAEPYFKARQQKVAFQPWNGAGGEAAQLRKQSTALQRDFAALLATHERQEASTADLRRKVRTLRGELEQRDKALELARRTVDRLSADKGQLEAGEAGRQAYVRRLEALLLSVKHAAELQQRCAQYKAELDQMAHAAHEAEARAAAAEASSRQVQTDSACLKRGLELAAEQLTKSAGAEVPGTLLMAVARGQEEALGLSLQLSDAKQQLGQVTGALEQAREHLQAQQQALTQHQSERQEQLERAQAADEALGRQQAATHELRRVLDALKPKAGALAVERDSLLQQLELERTAAAEAQKEVKQLKAALRQKATVEGALRDELRRALAGQGFTPSPQPATASRHQRSPPTASVAGQVAARSNSRQRSAAGVPPFSLQQPRSSSKRGGSPRVQQSAHKVVVRHAPVWGQQGQLQHSQWRQETVDTMGGGSLSKEFAQTPSLQQQLDIHIGNGSGNNSSGSSGGGGANLAEPSPTHALRHLQQQRRQQQQQGGRMMESPHLPQQQQHQEQEQQGQEEEQQQRVPSWGNDSNPVSGWQLELAEPLVTAHASHPGVKGGNLGNTGIAIGGGGSKVELQGCNGLLSPPSTDSKPGCSSYQSQQQNGHHFWHQNHGHHLPQQQQAALPGGSAPFLQDAGGFSVMQAGGHQMQLYPTLRLDAEIAALESDLARLDVVAAAQQLGAASPAGKARRHAGPAGKERQQRASSGVEADSLMQQRQDGQEGPLQPQDKSGIGAWRPNNPSNHAAAPLPAADATVLRVPTLWHSNPLATSPPKHHPQPSMAEQAEQPGEQQKQPEVQQQQQQQFEPASDGAVTIRARLASAVGNETAAAAAVVGAGAHVNEIGEGGGDDWVWSQLRSSIASQVGVNDGSGIAGLSDQAGWQQETAQQATQAAGQLLPVSSRAAAASGSAVGSPTLCLPSDEWSEEEDGQHQYEDEEEGEQLDQRQKRQAAAEEQQAAAWEGEEEEDNGRHEPPTLELQPYGAAESCGDVQSIGRRWDLPSPGPGNSDWLTSECEADIEQLEVSSGLTPAAQRTQHRQAQQQPEREASGSTGASHQGSGSSSGSGSGSGSESGEGLPLLQPVSAPDQSSQAQQAQRAMPLLPGMALVSQSPQPPPARRVVQRVRRVPRPQPQPQQPHTLAELAGMDMTDFLST